MTDPLPHVFAKSSRRGRRPESLVSHLAATLRAATELRDRIGRLPVAEEALGGQFWPAVRLAAVAHDAGKVAAGFQRLLTSGVRWGHRHEVVSLGFLPGLVPDESLRRWVASAVVTHHRPLTDSPDSIQLLYGGFDLDGLRAVLGPVSTGDAQALAAWLATSVESAGLPSAGQSEPLDVVALARGLLHELIDHWDLPDDDRDRGLAAVLLQGAVTLADHLSSAHGSLHVEQPIGAGFEKRLSLVREALYDHQVRAGHVDGHLLLRAPTGSGKTEAGLLWAAGQVMAIAAVTGGTPRVFLTLPYLASINAMAERLSALLGDWDAVGVAHSRAASYHLSAAIAAEDGPDSDERRVDAAHKAVSRAAATRLFRETVRVGTPYQLLRGALAGPAHSGILIDSANSVFVLDELHAYDARRLGYILATVRLWERLGGRVAVLSATLPDALAELVRETLRGRVELVDAGNAGTPPRHRVRIRERHLTAPDSVEEISGRLAGGQAVLVVANNVAHAQELLETLEPIAREHHGQDAAVLLHSRFKRRDRSRIEQRIRKRYGSGMDRRPGLVVATQVVEVSLDVDFDVLFTSAAPLEALLQRFGRVNRLGHRPPADVVVHEPTYRPRRGGSGEYADGVYPREPVETGWRILCRHADQVVDEVEATRWLGEVYATGWGERWRDEVRRYRETFEEAFLAFDYPYGGRDTFAERFDKLFDGTEAILAGDEEQYRDALAKAVRDDGRRVHAAGKLLGEELLIPMPFWAGQLTTFERQLRVRIVDGRYDDERGLLAVHGPDQARDTYRAGEVL